MDEKGLWSFKGDVRSKGRIVGKGEGREGERKTGRGGKRSFKEYRRADFIIPLHSFTLLFV